MVKQFNDDVMVVPLWTTAYSVVAQTYVHTNLLSAHHQIWSPGLDWMDEPAK